MLLCYLGRYARIVGNEKAALKLDNVTDDKNPILTGNFANGGFRLIVKPKPLL